MYICLISHITPRGRDTISSRIMYNAIAYRYTKNISHLFLNIERLSTAALAFTVGIVEGKLRTQLGFLPIHDGTDDIE